jgi:hypothetical protein
MADKFIEIDIKNEHEVIHHLEQVEERNQHRARELIDELSKFTENMLTIMVPTYSLYLFRHIDRSGPMWMPGGPGGGGEWKAIVGIKDGPSRHPEYVEFGTGIYGSKGGLIFPNTREGLAFRKRGESDLTGKPIVRRWVRGQKPQRYMYLTWGVLNALAHEKINETRLFN